MGPFGPTGFERFVLGASKRVLLSAKNPVPSATKAKHYSTTSPSLLLAPDD